MSIFEEALGHVFEPTCAFVVQPERSEQLDELVLWGWDLEISFGESGATAQPTAYEILRRRPTRHDLAKDWDGCFPSRHIEQSDRDEHFPWVILYTLCLVDEFTQSKQWY